MADMPGMLKTLLGINPAELQTTIEGFLGAIKNGIEGNAAGIADLAERMNALEIAVHSLAATIQQEHDPVARLGHLMDIV